MRENGPTVFLVALLALFGIHAATPDRGAAPAEAKGEKENKTAPAEVGGGDEHFWEPLCAFRRTGVEGKCEGDLPWPGFPDVAGWDLDTLIACVPDPTDSTSGYLFDSVVDAVQRAVETQGYVLDRYYYPWRGPKPPGAGEKAAPLDVTVRGTLVEAGKTQLTVKKAGKQRRYESEPGALLFRSRWFNAVPGAAGAVGLAAAPVFGPALALPALVNQPRLLLVLLVGETATAGIHKEAFTAGLRLIARSRRCRQTGEMRVLGPFFTGAQTSLAAAISGWAAGRRGAGRNLPRFRILSGAATGVEADAFPQHCLPAVVTFQATVSHHLDLVKALLQHQGLVSTDKRGRLGFSEEIAFLYESNTTFGRDLQDTFVRLQEEVERDARQDPAAQRKVNKGSLIFLPFPLHISDVRAAYSLAGTSHPVTLSLPSFGRNLRVPLEGGRAPRDTEPSLDPSMNSVQSESVLTGLLTTIARERFRYALIVATDVKDRLFLATLLRQHAPETRLLFAGGDLLLSHPDFRPDLRGAVVASPYPLYPTNQHWSFPSRGHERHLLFPGQSEQGCYNAVVALLAPGRPAELLDYGPPFVRRKDNEPPARRRPPVWISIIGQGGPQPLAAVPAADGDPYLYAAVDAGGGAGPVEFHPTTAGLWLVTALGGPVLVLAIAWNYFYGRRRGAGTGGEGLSALFRPRGHGHQGYVCASLLGLFAAFAYVAAIWSIPALHKLLVRDSPVALRWPDWLAVAVAALSVAAFLVLTLWRLVFTALRFLVLGLWSLAVGALSFLGRLRHDRAGLKKDWHGRWKKLRARASNWAAARKADLSWPSWPSVGTFFRRRQLPLLILLLVVAAALYLVTHRPKRLAPPDELLLLFERATNLADGVSPVFPVLLLGFGFYWWGSRHLKRLFLMDKGRRIRCPFPEEAPFDEARQCGAEVWRLLESPHAAGGAWRPAVWLALLFTFWRLTSQFVPSVEGPVYDGLMSLALALFALLLADAFLQLIATWWAVRDLLKEVAGVDRLTEAFRRIPRHVTALFGPYLSSQRPGRTSHREHRQGLRDEVVGGLERVRYRLQAELGWADDEMETLADGLKEADLSDAAATCLRMLSACWRSPALRARMGAFTRGETKDGDEVVEWLRLVEDFSAVQAVAYLSQFFVQLRTLLGFLTVGPLLLLFAVSSYPFHPQQLWLLFTGALVLIVTGVVLWMVIDIERDTAVSNILNTKPQKVSFNWEFLSHLLAYALPLLGVVAASSSGVSDLLHSWLDPVLRVLR